MSDAMSNECDHDNVSDTVGADGKTTQTCDDCKDVFLCCPGCSEGAENAIYHGEPLCPGSKKVTGAPAS